MPGSYSDSDGRKKLIARPLIFAFDRLRHAPKSVVGQRVNKILILEYWNLGDIVMPLSLFKELADSVSKCLFYHSALTSPKAAPLLEHQGTSRSSDDGAASLGLSMDFSLEEVESLFHVSWLELLRTASLLRDEQSTLLSLVRAGTSEILLFRLLIQCLLVRWVTGSVEAALFLNGQRNS